MNLIEESIEYFHAFAEGREAVPWDYWWVRNRGRLEQEVSRGEFLRFKCKPFQAVCDTLRTRGISFKPSERNAKVQYTNLGTLHDPIEDDPEIKPLIEAADRQARALLVNEPLRLGFCHVLWRTKQRILKDQYGIDWRTPAEMNPKVMFD